MAIVDVTIPNDGSTERAEKVLINLLNSMEGKYEALIKAPEFLGIEKISPEEIVFRVKAETKPMHHIEISRILRKEISAALDASGIKSTYNGSES